MDIGAGLHPTSLAWLVPRYETLGVRFDEKWAWELAAVDPQKYWSEVPADVKPRLHVSGRFRRHYYIEGLA